MPSPQVFSGVCFEDSGIIVRNQVKIWDETIGEQADFSSMTYKIFDQKTGQQITSGTLSISTVVSNSPFPTADDGTQYNFEWAMPATFFPEGSKTYQAEVLVIPTTGEQFWVVWAIRTLPVFTS